MRRVTRYASYSTRMPAAPEPLDDDIRAELDRVMRGNPPLVLFTTLARDRRLFCKFFGAGLLDRGNVTIREREIMIDRTTALCGAEYEWGVHVSRFGASAGLTTAQITSLIHGDARDECWRENDRVLIDLCDELHRTCGVSDELWARLTSRHSDEAILELLLLAGFYHTTSFVVNALTLPLEDGMARFASFPRQPPDAHTGPSSWA